MHDRDDVIGTADGRSVKRDHNEGGPVSGDDLLNYIERIERLDEEKATIASDIKEVYAEVKAAGFDTKTVRQIVRIRKQDRQEREEMEARLDLYMHAIGLR